MEIGKILDFSEDDFNLLQSALNNKADRGNEIRNQLKIFKSLLPNVTSPEIRATIKQMEEEADSADLQSDDIRLLQAKLVQYKRYLQSKSLLSTEPVKSPVNKAGFIIKELDPSVWKPLRDLLPTDRDSSLFLDYFILESVDVSVFDNVEKADTLEFAVTGKDFQWFTRFSKAAYPDSHITFKKLALLAFKNYNTERDKYLKGNGTKN